MTVIAFDKYIKESPMEEVKMVEFDELLAQSDFITLHIPFIKEEGPTLSTDEFAKMKDGVYIVNCARGGVVDEAALLDALNSGKVGKAAIDVFEEEPPGASDLVKHDKVYCTPHIGASTKEAQDRVGLEVADIIIDFFK
jgi:phosphoglycerate dehydrogenase-like enzyme